MDSIWGTILLVLVLTIIGAPSYVMGAKVFKEQITWPQAFLIAVCSSLALLIPGIFGFIAFFAVAVVMIHKFAVCDIWPDSVVVALVAALLSVCIIYIFASIA